jgi:hypothetical protein
MIRPTISISSMFSKGWQWLSSRSARGVGAVVLFTSAAFGQDSGGSTVTNNTPSSGNGNSSGNGSRTTVTNTYVPPWGYPQPGSGATDSHLPSSSKMTSNAGSFSDGFDFGKGNGGAGTLRGSKDSWGTSRTRPAHVPEYHVVRKGDTLWGLCGHYHRNPWMWPKVWSYNPHIQNPHWIYPGDHLRLRTDLDGSPKNMSSGAPRSRPSTVFLRDQGFIDNPKRDTWGLISGSPLDRMILAEGDAVYLEVDKDHPVVSGQELTIFRTVRNAPKGGAVVQILGTVKIETWNEKKGIARAKITESLDAIERGAKIGAVGRKFSVVPPKRNETEMTTHVLLAVHPHVFYGQNQVVFVDKGTKDGLKKGNRLFVVRRGDSWRKTLKNSGLADQAVRHTSEEDFETETVQGTKRDKDYPTEIVGELRVLRVRENTSTCLVTHSKSEIFSGDLAVARQGY